MALPSAEIAENFKDALDDLTHNDRHQINSLAGLANEHSEHGLAISRELEKHIKTTVPSKRLPALYLLDSIVKNYGRPYSDIFARNLYNTFMDAYSKVDDNVRRSMELLLKTWKTPVPGSADTRPVFPPDVTRQIDIALSKARDAYSQSARMQQLPMSHQMASRPQMQPWGHTSTPPQHDPRFQPPPQAPNGYPYPGQLPGYPPGPPQHQPFSPPPMHQYPSQQPPFNPASFNQSNPDNSWISDLDVLVREAQGDAAANPGNQQLATKLKALQDLQTYLRTQQLSPDQRRQIRDQVYALKASSPSANAPPQPPHTPFGAISTPPVHQANPTPAAFPFNPPASQPPPPSAASLAQILATAQARSTPPPGGLSFGPPPPAPASTGGAPPNPLLDALRAAGIFQNSTPADRPGSSSAMSSAFPPPPLPGMNGTPTLHFGVRAPLGEIKNDVQLNSAALRIPRPHLISKLFTTRPNQCSTCGRRFPMTDAGKAAKARHLDWHFRTNLKMSEASKRGSTRSWFMKELEFTRYREFDDSEDSAAQAGTSPTQDENKEKDTAKSRYVRAPTDMTLSRQPCPICQEPFSTSWHEELQEWVWMDAVQVGQRIFHGTCRDEVAKSTAAAPVSVPRKGTPDSVLGKRKGDGGEGERRVKREMVTA